MRIRLNLATKTLETHRRFLAGAGLIAAVAGIIFIGLGWHVYSARRADSELRARADKTRQEMARLETQRSELERYFNQKDIAELNARAAFINGIIDASSFNSAFFRAACMSSASNRNKSRAAWRSNSPWAPPATTPN